MSLDAFPRAVELIAGADSVLLTSHRRPDGDGVGSLIALATMLRERGKRATLYTPDLVPRNLKWLPLGKKFVRKLKKTDKYDATVIVDCGDRKLLGDQFPPPEVTGPLVVLDHHAHARPFGDVFMCDPQAASVGVIIARIAHQLGWAITPDAAQGIYVSIVSDTGSFRYANANAEAFRVAAELVDSGAVNPWAITERMQEQAPVSRYRLLAAALGTLELVADGKLAFITITDEMVKAAEAQWEDSEGIVNYARAIAGVECGVLITPARGGGIRVSMRCKARLIDAGAVCLELGGGGHPGAAGCHLQGSLEDARARVQAALEQALRVAAESR